MLGLGGGFEYFGNGEGGGLGGLLGGADRRFVLLDAMPAYGPKWTQGPWLEPAVIALHCVVDELLRCETKQSRAAMVVQPAQPRCFQAKC